MARQLTNAKPKNMKKTLSSFKKYIGNHKYAFVLLDCLLFFRLRLVYGGLIKLKQSLIVMF